MESNRESKSQYTTRPEAPAELFIPPPVNRLEDTGLSGLWLQDLTLKILYYLGYLTGFKVAEQLSLPFSGVVDQILEVMKREKLVEIKSAQQMGLGEGTYVYGITNLGIERAREALERSQYAGPAPVPLEDYCNAVLAQSRKRMVVNDNDLRRALQGMVLPEAAFERIGPAVNSGTSIFLYGPPGNGKTTIARAIGNMTLDESIYVPHALYVDGLVVKLFDSVNHQQLPDGDDANSASGQLRGSNRRDLRWKRIRRPFIMTGGELTLAGLDLVFDDVNKYYEAPLQVKANGGILLIDDFGRQLVRPRDLLNRWIVPLENRIDYMTLHTGRKVEVPFDVLVIFSTNLPPKDLVDEAFLRRLRHKIDIIDPSYEEYREIFKNVAAAKGVNYSDSGLAYLLQEWYIRRNRKLRGSHPRDICEQILDIAHYLAVEPDMNNEMIDRAGRAFFVDL